MARCFGFSITQTNSSRFSFFFIPVFAVCCGTFFYYSTVAPACKTRANSTQHPSVQMHTGIIFLRECVLRLSEYVCGLRWFADDNGYERLCIIIIIIIIIGHKRRQMPKDDSWQISSCLPGRKCLCGQQLRKWSSCNWHICVSDCMMEYFYERMVPRCAIHNTWTWIISQLLTFMIWPLICHSIHVCYEGE